MNNITVSAKTYDEAITKALIQLETTSEHLIVEVLEKGSNGLFGMIGGRPWTIRAHVKSEEEEARELEAKRQAEAEQRKEKEEAERAAAREAEERKAKEAAEQEAARRREEEQREAAKSAEEAVRVQPETAKELQEKKESGRKESSEKKSRSRDGRRNHVEKRREENVGREVLKEEAEEIQSAAAAFLSEIFRAMEETIQIDTDFNYQENELAVTLSGDDMGALIGKRGQTLDSLQYLVSLVVNKHRDVYIRVKLDTENYRERREQKLRSLARNIARKVKQTRRSVTLEPMNPYERRIIHSALQRDPYVTTCSEGEDPYRHVVVVLKKDQRSKRREEKSSEE